MINSFLKMVEDIGLFGKAVGLVLTGMVTWFFVRKKQSAETEKTKADASKSEVETIIAANRYNKEAFKELLIEANALREENRKNREIIEKQDRKIDELTRKINAMDTFRSIHK